MPAISRRWRAALLRLFVTILLLSISTAAQSTPTSLRDSPKALVDEVWQTVNSQFVNAAFDRRNWDQERSRLLGRDYRDRQDAYRAIRTSLAKLADPYTRFMEPAEARHFSAQLSGQGAGIGILLDLEVRGRLPVVTRTLEGSPAHQAGVRAGDRLLALEGRLVTGIPPGELSSRLQGVPGSLVHLAVLRGRGKTLHFTLTRRRYVLPTVTASLRAVHGLPFGYISLAEFSNRSPEEVELALVSLTEAGARGWILDLRGNPGGLLDAAGQITGMFLDRGTIVSVIGRTGREAVLTASGRALTRLPVVVLIDGNSASASEVLAAALQDHHRATLVGSVSFGKGLIQQYTFLSDGSALSVTCAHYFTPAGRDIHKKGVLPDIEVAAGLSGYPVGGDDKQYWRAVAVLAPQLGTMTEVTRR